MSVSSSRPSTCSIWRATRADSSGKRRKKRPCGAVGGDAGEGRAHVGLAPAHFGDGCERAAELLERDCERAGEPRRVGVAVVDGGHAAQAELVVGEFGDGLCEVEVVAGGAVVAGVVVGAGVAAQVGGERGRGIGGGDHHQAGFAEDGGGDRGGDRAGGADEADDARVAGDGLCGAEAAWGGAE